MAATDKDAKRARLAQALRANLRRRKDQARARDDDPVPETQDAPPPEAPDVYERGDGC